MIKGVPEKFLVFQSILDEIEKFSPTAMSIVGSYGDADKTPTEYSDLDLIFVFDTSDIFCLYSQIVEKIKNVPLYYVAELGVHYQFGYLISVYIPTPLLWIDVGIMDQHFASNYLVNLPQTPIFGTITPPSNHQVPFHNQNHMARKIITLIKGCKIFKAREVAYRYISWRLLELRLLGRNSKEARLEYDDLIKRIERVSGAEILEIAVKDIEDRCVLCDNSLRCGNG